MKHPRALLVALVLWTAACDGGEVVADASVADAGAVDAGPPITCEVPTVTVAGTPETDALANAPARCGQPAHVWLRDPSLGTPITVGEPERFMRRILAATAMGLDATLPREPAHDVQARLVTYQTQDRGALVEATAVVAYPDGMSPGTELPVVLFLHGTSGFTDGCGAGNDFLYRTLTALVASWGYLVVTPDFLGLRTEGETGFSHPYLVGQPTAIAALDSVRAALRLDPAERGETCGQTDFVSWGGSQGGHAVLWVDRLAPYYAPELSHLGGVAAVPPADLEAQFARGLSSLVSATGNTTAFYGTAPDWYGLTPRLTEVFVSPWDADIPARLASECSPDLDPPSTLDDVFNRAFLDAAGADMLASYGDLGCIARENGLLETSVARLGGDGSAYGVLFVTGENDDLVHTPIERESFRTICEAGMPIAHLECAGAPHAEGALWALPETFEFLDARLAGEAFTAPTSCEPTAPIRCRGTPEGS